MLIKNENRFQDFFEDGKYVAFKNHLYNYLLRKRAVGKVMSRESHELILEVGSGISPIMTKADRIVYSDISFIACRMLRLTNKSGLYVVADATALPFKAGVFSHIVSSEVLEHIKDDGAVLCELNRVTKLAGFLVVTFPHRKVYFANDDRYVKHFRRYELVEIENILHESGFQSLIVMKVLGPLEKLMMMAAVVIFETMLKILPKSRKASKTESRLRWAEIPFAWANKFLAAIVGIDAFIMPVFLAACLLIKAEKVK